MSVRVNFLLEELDETYAYFVGRAKRALSGPLKEGDLQHINALDLEAGAECVATALTQSRRI